MKKNLLCGSIIAAAVSLCMSCNNSSTGGSTTDSIAAGTDSGMSANGNTDSAARIEKNPSTLSKVDSQFVLKAANAGMTEVALGNIAVNNSADEKVRAFGQMMIKDHTTAGEQLRTIALSKNMTLPDSLSAESKKHESELSKKKGKDFDKAYISAMVTGHEKVLKDFEDAQSKGSDAELKAFVAQTIPVIKTHLDQARSIKKELK